MAFVKKIGNSLYSPDFYGRVIEGTLGSALGYFFLLILLFTLLRVAVLTGPLILGVGPALQSGLAEQVSLFPNDLRLDFDRGRVTTNVREPYAVPASRGIAEALHVKNLLVVDTGTPFSPARFNQYQTVVWLTSDAAHYGGGSEAEIKSQDLTQLTREPWHLDRALLDEGVRAVHPYLGLVGPAIGVGAFVLFFLASSFRLVQLFLLALVVWVLSMLLSKRRSYGASYRVGLYAMTLPLIVELALDLAGQRIPLRGFPYMFSLLTLGVVLVNLVSTNRRQVPEQQAP